MNQALPEIQSTVTIDASTQPNYRFGQNMVQLHGGTQLQNTDGMVIRAADSVVRGLAIAGIPGDGIVIRGNESTGNRIESNVIGLTAALQRNIESSNGTPRRAGNHRSGVLLADGASKNFVGTNMDGANDTGEANIITGNYLNGISIVGGSNDNTIAANQIGRGDIGNGFSLATSDVFEPTIDVLSNQPAQVRDASLSFSAAGRRADWTGQSVTFTSGILASIPLRIESDDSDDGEIFVEARQFTFPEGNAFDARLGQHIGVVGGNGVYILDSSGTIVGDPNVDKSDFANTITAHVAAGISVEGSARRNRFHANTIVDNGGLAIDLARDGLTINDNYSIDKETGRSQGSDRDVGANDLQNF
ncbi:MAG: hypothetical protein AAFP90_23240, partial [Planctomycetota bacterium]